MVYTIRRSLFAILYLAVAALPVAAQPANEGVIEGTVESADGAEAGVWVIAETDDTPTHFVKIVVTDDDGRFVLPELPDAQFSVWVRGYGLVDSDPVFLRPGASGVTLKAFAAEDPL